MEIMGMTKGIVVDFVRHEDKYCQKGLCPECDSSLNVFQSAWGYKEFVHTSGPLAGYKEDYVVCQCPICGTYFKKDFTRISSTLDILRRGMVYYG